MSDVMDEPDAWCREYGLVLRSGRGVREDRFSLDRDGAMAQGYDCSVYLEQPDMRTARLSGSLEHLTPAEWAEIADVMIVRWQALKARMEAMQPEPPEADR